MSSMEELVELTTRYAEQHNALRVLMETLEGEVDAIRRNALPAIRSRIARVSAAHEALYQAIEGSPDLFVKPRTVIIAGVRVGLAKGRGRVEIDDEAAVVDRIRRLLPEEQADLLIRVRESVDRNAVGDLTVADLKRLGIRIEESGDEVVIKAADSSVDKLVAALLKDAARIDPTEEAA